MTRTRLSSLALAAALLAGCGDSSTPAKPVKKGPFPVERPNVTAGSGGTPTTPVGPETRTNDPDPVKQPDRPKDVKPPPPPPDAKKGQAVGDAAPELVLEDAAGQPFILTSYRDKQPVLIVFGATWCPKCAAALPDLEAARKSWEPKGLVVAEIFLGEDGEKAKKYAADRGTGQRLLPDVRQLSRARYGYNVDDMPFHVLVGKDGKVLASGHSVPTAEEIEKALK